MSYKRGDATTCSSQNHFTKNTRNHIRFIRHEHPETATVGRRSEMSDTSKTYNLERTTAHTCTYGQGTRDENCIPNLI